MIVLGCKIPHELDALKWKAIGRRRRKDKIQFIQQVKPTDNESRLYFVGSLLKLDKNQ
jgi:hypothetical protein